jgi:SET domain-containing protein
MHKPSLMICPSPLGGRGVFALEDIVEGALIEICPVLIIPPEQVEIIHNTVLHDYYFLWGDEENQAVIALGYGSLYNHLNESNAYYEMDFEHACIDIYAHSNISKGDEITINYHGEPGMKGKLWF